MYKIKALAKMYGLSSKQARDRLTALKPLIDAYSQDGKDNAIQYAEQGRAMLDRLLQVERENGLTIRAAADRVKEEFQAHFPGPNGHVDEDLLDRIQELETELEEQSKAYEKQLADLQRTITKHDGRLANVEEQVQYMLEAPQDETTSTGTHANGRHADEDHVEVESAVETAGHGHDGPAAEAEPHADNTRIEIAVDGNLSRWRRILANVPLISRILT